MRMLLEKNAICSIDDCGRNARYLSRLSPFDVWCPKHYRRWQKTGDPFGMRKPGSPGLPGPRHPQWKPDGDITYEAMHIRLRVSRGRASEHLCVDCTGPADQWSYTPGCPDEKTRADGAPYSTDPTRYVPRCFSCHTKFDHARVGAHV